MDKYPVTFVLFGATGDLAEKKLFPALYGLYIKKLIPRHFKIVAFARRPFTDESFRELILPGIVSAHGIAPDSDSSQSADVKEFLQRIVYHQGLFDETKPYISLINRLGDIDKELGACSHKIFHLSVSPFFYETVLDHLEKSALNLSCTDGTGQTRLLIEKPIGTDLESARTINKLLGNVFHEDQIYRVDHYLAKNALLHLLSLRFENPELLKVWNAEHIESIRFCIYEKITADGRGAFYEKVGALRDVGQNHLLEMFALATARSVGDPPARAAALREITFPSSDPASEHLLKRAQYEGYRAEEGVAKESDVETYFKVPLSVEDDQWKNVRFELEGGKALQTGEVFVRVIFKKSLPTSFALNEKSFRGVSMMTFYVQPEPRAVIVHADGVDTLLYKSKDAPDNYEKIYSDALSGERSHFVSKEEVEASWLYIDVARKELLKQPLKHYKQGTAPEEIA